MWWTTDKKKKVLENRLKAKLEILDALKYYENMKIVGEFSFAVWNPDTPTEKELADEMVLEGVLEEMPLQKGYRLKWAKKEEKV